MNKNFIKDLMLVNGFMFLSFGLYYAFIDNNVNNWFSRWTTGLILLGFYGVMEHINSKDDE